MSGLYYVYALVKTNNLRKITYDDIIHLYLSVKMKLCYFWLKLLLFWRFGLIETRAALSFTK